MKKRVDAVEMEQYIEGVAKIIVLQIQTNEAIKTLVDTTTNREKEKKGGTDNGS